MENEARRRGADEETIRNAKSLIGVDREYLDNALKFAEEEYGSIISYLNNQLGVSNEAIKFLQNKYLK